MIVTPQKVRTEMPLQRMVCNQSCAWYTVRILYLFNTVHEFRLDVGSTQREWRLDFQVKLGRDTYTSLAFAVSQAGKSAIPLDPAALQGCYRVSAFRARKQK